MKYNYKCECGSVFLTQSLLDSHKRGKCAQPQAPYTLGFTVKPYSGRDLKTVSDKKCRYCKGSGVFDRGQTKDGKGHIYTRCPNVQYHTSSGESNA